VLVGVVGIPVPVGVAVFVGVIVGVEVLVGVIVGVAVFVDVCVGVVGTPVPVGVGVLVGVFVGVVVVVGVGLIIGAHTPEKIGLSQVIIGKSKSIQIQFPKLRVYAPTTPSQVVPDT
jgi:hypothetical protein